MKSMYLKPSSSTVRNFEQAIDDIDTAMIQVQFLYTMKRILIFKVRYQKIFSIVHCLHERGLQQMGHLQMTLF